MTLISFINLNMDNDPCLCISFYVESFVSIYFSCVCPRNTQDKDAFEVCKEHDQVLSTWTQREKV